MKRILIYQIIFRATLLFGNEDFLLISSIVKVLLLRVNLFNARIFVLLEATHEFSLIIYLLYKFSSQIAFIS